MHDKGMLKSTVTANSTASGTVRTIFRPIETPAYIDSER